MYFTSYKKIGFYLSSFIISLIIMMVSLLTQGIYLHSSTTILASDGFHQYVNFNTALSHILHGKDSLFYNFGSGLGLNFYALSSYYLGSFLSPLTYFFNSKSMPDAIYLFTLLKFGFIGLAAFTALNKIYTNVNLTLTLCLSTSYALMSFSTSQFELTNWLDVFILLPLILLGLHHLLKKADILLYYISLTFLFIQNYYFGFIVAIFITLWFLVQLSYQQSKQLTAIFRFIITSLLAVLSSAVILLPTYLDLKNHGENFDSFTHWLSEDVWFFDFFAKNIIGSYDTTQFHALPMIYAGVLPLMLGLNFFFIPNIKLIVKLAYASFIAFILSCFYLEPLDLIWQGMHEPNMFLHRYAWALPTVFIFMSANTLSHLNNIRIKPLIFVSCLLTIGFTGTYFFKDTYDFLNWSLFLLTACFLLAYTLSLWGFSKNIFSQKTLIIILNFFMLLEISLNTFYQVKGISNEWNFPSRTTYFENLTEIDNLVTFSKEQTSSFFRTESLFPKTGNDSLKFGFNGISQFSSIRNRKSSQQLDRLGFRSDGTNLNLRYQNNTLIADSLFAVKYNISQFPITKFGFKTIKKEGNISLYQNHLAGQLAILTPEIYQDFDETINTLDNQTKLLNQLAGTNYRYFHHLTAQNLSIEPKLNSNVTVKPQDGETKISYKVTIPAKQQVYVSLPHLNLGQKQDKLYITINSRTSTFTTDNAFSFFDLGYFDTPEEAVITFHFPNSTLVTFDQPHFYGLDTRNYKQAMTLINKEKVNVSQQANQIHMSFNARKNSSLFITLPYDKGWLAYENNKRLDILPAQKGFLKLNISKGNHRINLVFIPQGFHLGLFLSSLGILLTTLYYIFTKKQDVSKQ